MGTDGVWASAAGNITMVNTIAPANQECRKRFQFLLSWRFTSYSLSNLAGWVGSLQYSPTVPRVGMLAEIGWWQATIQG